jgi:hypothetical protein
MKSVQAENLAKLQRFSGGPISLFILDCCMTVQYVHVKKRLRTTLIVTGVVGRETCGQRGGCDGLSDELYLSTAR